MEFEIFLDYTVEDFAAYWQGFMSKPAGKRSFAYNPPKPLRAVGRFCCWMFVVLGAVSVVNSLWQGKRMYMEGEGLFIWLMNLGLTTPLGGILEIAFGVFGLRNTKRDAGPPSSGPPYPRWAQKAWKRWQKAGQGGTCVFSGEGFQLHNAKSDYRCDYTELDKLWEDEGHFYAVLGSRAVYILPKAKFTAGDPADLPAFWRERTGKQVLPVNPEK